MEMLQNEKVSDIISWTPDGNAFSIHDKKRFASEVLPLYFKESIQFSSFTRRMNRWKFTLTSGSTKSRSVYHHPLFKRNEMQKCSEMKPKPQTTKKASSAIEMARKNAYEAQGNKENRSIAVLSGEKIRQHEMSFQPPPPPPIQYYDNQMRTPPLTLSGCQDHTYEKMAEGVAYFDRRPCNSSAVGIEEPCQYEELFPQTIHAYRPSQLSMPIRQQEMHLRHLQTDPVYQGLFNSSLRDIHAIHQAKLAVEMELSHLALMSSRITQSEGI